MRKHLIIGMLLLSVVLAACAGPTPPAEVVAEIPEVAPEQMAEPDDNAAEVVEAVIEPTAVEAVAEPDPSDSEVMADDAVAEAEVESDSAAADAVAEVQPTEENSDLLNAAQSESEQIAEEPTAEPAAEEPTAEPATEVPTTAPEPTEEPTAVPPTDVPTEVPTDVPTEAPAVASHNKGAPPAFTEDMKASPVGAVTFGDGRPKVVEFFAFW